MESWKIPTIILCLYGFFKSLKPIESFLEPFLVSPDKNLTEEVVNNEIFPVWTYSYLSIIVVVFLLTDLLRYKVVIVLEGFAYIGTWALLLWAKSVLAMKFMQFTYGIATATEIAYFSYIYAVVPSEKYNVVSGCTRAALLIGKCLSGVVGQVLMSTHVGSYQMLNIISFTSVSFACLITFFLPRVKHTTYFHQEISPHNELDSQSHTPKSDISIETNSYSIKTNESIGSYKPENDESHRISGDISNSYGTIDVHSLANSYDYKTDDDETESHKWQRSTTSRMIDSDLRAIQYPVPPKRCSCTNCTNAMKAMAHDFGENYSKRSLLLWSVWWAIATCGDLQVLNYAQNLWDVIGGKNMSDEGIYNGAVDAISTFTGASCAFSITFAPVNWDIYGELLLAVVSLGNCAMLVVMARTNVIWVAYTLYGVFRAAYQTVITVATFQIAKHLDVQRYALVFGFNTFMALVLQAILTVIVVDKSGFNVGIRTQFVVNGGYFGVMGLVLLVAAILTLRKYWCGPQDYYHLQDEEIANN